MYNYDDQIIRLTKQPRLILDEWKNGIGFFRTIGRTSRAGCLTFIRNNSFLGSNVFIKDEMNIELTEQIRNDELLPKRAEDIRPSDLPRFKHWWLIIDGLENASEDDGSKDHHIDYVEIKPE